MNERTEVICSLTVDPPLTALDLLDDTAQLEAEEEVAECALINGVTADLDARQSIPLLLALDSALALAAGDGLILGVLRGFSPSMP